VGLAVYVLYKSGSTLIGREIPQRSIPGVIVAAFSVVVMPLLAQAKRRAAAGIRSGASQAKLGSIPIWAFGSLTVWHPKIDNH
jgi:divalent metal cation (Fe/Co/Zn/Cd) transporter